jgi:hypothetical protein
MNTFVHRELLSDDDSITKLDAIQKLDLQDYINMRKMGVTTQVAWKSIRSMVVTKHGVTLWQLSEKYLDSLHARAIGTIESPVHLFEWILKNSSQ